MTAFLANKREPVFLYTLGKQTNLEQWEIQKAVENLSEIEFSPELGNLFWMMRKF